MNEIERKPWTLDQVRALCDDLEPVVSRCGFLLTVYGSTLRKGRGRDLDLILCQKRIGATPAYVLRDVREHLKAEQIGEVEESLFAEKCVLLLMPDGHLLDIQVRMSPIRDAYDLYMSGKTALQTLESR